MIKYKAITEFYSIPLLLDNLDTLFVFGDNLQRYGCAGQACIRHQPNSFGIATKISPTASEEAYFSNNMNTEAIIEAEFYSLQMVAQANNYSTVVFPAAGLGTGLAKLETKAPKLLDIIDDYVSFLIQDDFKKYRKNLNEYK